MRLRSALITLYALYVVFILLTQVPILAKESAQRRAETVHDYYLTFTGDGYTPDGHYYVELSDTTKVGKVNVVYTMETNSLKVDAINVKTLVVFCHSIYQEKSMEVFGIAYDKDSNFYKKYFLDHDEPLTANVATTDRMELVLIDIPYPYDVEVDGRRADSRARVDYSISTSDSKVRATLPPGSYEVTINFKYEDFWVCVESFYLDSPTYGIRGEAVGFNVSTMFKCAPLRYYWDFGDNPSEGDWETGQEDVNTNFLEESIVTTHIYRKVGNYTVIFTIFDDIMPIYSERRALRIVEEKTDSDGDGMPDWWEEEYGLNSFDGSDAALDDDFDGISNFDEYELKTDPLSTDTDRDGLDDYEEIELGIDPLSGDSDGDGFRDGDEVDAGTDPGDDEDVPKVDRSVITEEGAGNLGLVVLMAVLVVAIIIILLVFVLKVVKVPFLEYTSQEREVSELLEYECPACGGTVTKGDTECGSCGESFEMEEFGCPSCGTIVTKDTSECPECGEEFEVEEEVLEAEVLEYEDVEDEGMASDEDLKALEDTEVIEEGEDDEIVDSKWDGEGGIESVCCPHCGTEIDLKTGSCPGCGSVIDLKVKVESVGTDEEAIELVPGEDVLEKGEKEVIAKEEKVDDRPLEEKVDSVIGGVDVKDEEIKVDEVLTKRDEPKPEAKKIKKRIKVKKKDHEVLIRKEVPKLEEKKGAVKKRQLKKRAVKK